MTKTIATLTLIVLLPGIAFAGSYTFTTTARQDAVLAYKLKKVNDNLALHGQPLLTANTFFQQFVVEVLTQYKREFDETTKIEACETYRALSSTDQNMILTKLGGKSPCS